MKLMRLCRGGKGSGLHGNRLRLSRSTVGTTVGNNEQNSFKIKAKEPNDKEDSSPMSRKFKIFFTYWIYLM